mgnify:CR=1 FL=1
MRNINKYLFVSLGLLYLFASIVSVVGQEGYFITSEKIIDSGILCADEGFEEVGTFYSGNGQVVRHCVQNELFDASILYVTHSYFEMYDGVTNCGEGGELEGSFNDNSGNITNLCVYRRTGNDVPSPKEDNLIRNVTIATTCPTGYNSGLSVGVQGGSIFHCSLGGNVAGNIATDRQVCGANTRIIMDNSIVDECEYAMTDQNSLGQGVDIGSVLEAELNMGGAVCPQTIDCRCVEGGDNGPEFNCNRIEEDTEEVGECILTNARWTNNNAEELTSARYGENVSLLADASEGCEEERNVTCKIYKDEPTLEEDVYIALKTGKIKTADDGNRYAWCDWKIASTPLRIAPEAERYSYFKIWLSNLPASINQSQSIQIFNQTDETPIEELGEEELIIAWHTSTRYSALMGCPQDQFVVREQFNFVWCAQFEEFTRSNSSGEEIDTPTGNNIVWGPERIVRGSSLSGKACGSNEAVVQIKDSLAYILPGSMKCRTMQSEEGMKVARVSGQHIEPKQQGCKNNGVVFGYNTFGNKCSGDLHLTEMAAGIAGIGPSGNNGGPLRNLFGGLRGGLGGGVLSGLLGNLSGLLGIFR